MAQRILAIVIGLLALALLVVLLYDLVVMFGSVATYSFFFGFFQDHFALNIWIIRIISAFSVLLFVLYVLPAMVGLLNPLSSKRTKAAAGVTIVVLYSALCFFTYLSEKDRKFAADGTPLTCVAWADTSYEPVPCSWKTHPTYGTPTITVTQEVSDQLKLRRIRPNKRTTWFDPIDGTPRVHYYANNSEIEFYNSAGRHPYSGEPLLPVNKDIIQQHNNAESKATPPSPPASSSSTAPTPRRKSSNDQWGLEPTVDSLEDQLKNY